MAKVTVLTAVYNAERYLRPCLDSLKNQTLTDCQFIWKLRCSVCEGKVHGHVGC